MQCDDQSTLASILSDTSPFFLWAATSSRAFLHARKEDIGFLQKTKSGHLSPIIWVSFKCYAIQDLQNSKIFR
jgi:hypothetical protein